MKPAHRPIEPGCLKIHSISVAPHQVLRQDHDKPLEDDQEQVLLIRLRGLQFVLQLLNLILGGFLSWFVLPAAAGLVLAVRGVTVAVFYCFSCLAGILL